MRIHMHARVFAHTYATHMVVYMHTPQAILVPARLGLWPLHPCPHLSLSGSLLISDGPICRLSIDAAEAACSVSCSHASSCWWRRMLYHGGVRH